MATKTEEVKIKFTALTDTLSFKLLERELTNIQVTWARMSNKNPMIGSFEQAAKEASKLESAMAAAYNPKLNTYNLDILNTKLKQSGTSVNQVVEAFNKIGYSGESAVLTTINGLTSMNLLLEKTETILDKIGANLLKTAGWFVASSAIHAMASSVSEAYGYVKALDTSLNDIRIVTYKSAEEMDKFAEKANKAAFALGKGTKDYTEASLIYYQQGLSDEETAARTDVTIKAANVTLQSTAEVSEQLTAVWNGYKVSADEAEHYVDKLAAVAAQTAADLEELSTGMSKVASAANTVGVNVDQMNAMLATTISVTKQSPETVGVAYKTILARMTQLEAGETDEEGVTLGNYTEKMKGMGINVLDELTGKLRDMGEVIEEVGTKWLNFSRELKIALAQTMAGTRQYNNLVALFDNWDMYIDALLTSEDALGTLNKLQDIYMESTAAHLQQMRTATEGVYDSLLDTKTINEFFDALTEALKVTEKIVDGFGGLKGILATLVPLFMQIFNKQIATNMTDMIMNFSNQASNKAQISERFANIDRLKEEFAANNTLLPASAQDVLNRREHLSEMAPFLNTTQIAQASLIIDKYTASLQGALNALERITKTGETWNKESEKHILLIDAEKVATNDYIKELNALTAASNEYVKTREKIDIFKDKNTGTRVVSDQLSLLDMGSNKETIVKDFYDKYLLNIGGVTYNNQNMGNYNALIDAIQKSVNEYYNELAISTQNAGVGRAKGTTTLGRNMIDRIMRDLVSNADLSTQDRNNIETALQQPVKDLMDATYKAVQDIAVEEKKTHKGTNIFSELLNNKDVDTTKFSQEFVNKMQGFSQEYDRILKLSNPIERARDYKVLQESVSAYSKSFKYGAEEEVEALNKTTEALAKDSQELIKHKMNTEDNAKALKEFDISATISKVTSAASGVGMMTSSVSNITKQFASGAGLSNLPSLLTSVGFAGNAAIQSIKGLSAAFSLSTPAAAAITAIFTAVTVALTALTEHYKQAAEAAKEYYEKTKEEAEQANENLQNAEAIKKSYEELGEEYKNGTKTLEELRTSTYDLLKSYEEEDLAVLALYSSYDELNKLIERNLELKLLENVINARRLANAAEGVVNAEKNAGGPLEKFGNALKPFIASANEFYYNSLFGSSVGIVGRLLEKDTYARNEARGSRGLAGRMTSDLDELFGNTSALDTLSVETLEDKYIKLKELRDKYAKEYLETLDETAKLIYEDILLNINRIPENVRTALDEAYMAEIAALDNQAKEIFGRADFSGDLLEQRNILTELFKKLYGDTKTNEEIDELIHKFFLGKKETQDYEFKHTLSKSITGTNDDVLFSWFDKLSPEKLGFLDLNIDIFLPMWDNFNISYADMKEKLEELYPTFTDVQNLIENAINSESINVEDIYNIDGIEEYEKEASISFSDAYKEGTVSAKAWLIEFYNWYADEAKKKQDAIPKLSVKDFINEADYSHYNISSFDTEDEMRKALEEQSSKDRQYVVDTVGEDRLQELLDLKKQGADITKEENQYIIAAVEYYYLALQALDALVAAEKIQQTLLDNLNKSKEETIKLNNALINQELSTGDSSSKKAQKTLSSAEKEFEKNGYLSPETFKELVALGDKYRDAWHNANGEVEFNSEIIKNIDLIDASRIVKAAEENYLLAQLNKKLAMAEMIVDGLNEEEKERLSKLDEEIAKQKILLNDAKQYEDYVKQSHTENEEEAAEAGYYKQKEYEAPKRSTQYIDDEIKQIEDEISYLEKEAEYLTGDSLTKNLEQQKLLREEIIALKEEEVKYNDETINQAKKEYEALAALYGIKVKYDESGRVSRETMEAMDAATEAAKKSALDAENAAGVAKEANTDKDSKKTFDNQYKQAQENLEKANKLADKNKELSSTINSTINENNKIEREIPEEKRAAALADVSRGYVDVTDKVRGLNQQYKLQDAQLQKIKEDFDSLSPDEQLKALQEMKVLKDLLKEEVKQEIQTYAEALQEGLKDVDLGTLDISDIASKSSAELEVMKELLEDLANKAHERGDIVSEQAIRAAIDQMDGLTDAAKRQEEQNKKTAVSWKELHEAQNAGEFEGVNNALSQTEKQLKRIKSAQSGLKGKDLINNLKQQQALLQKQVALEKLKLAIAAQQTKATAADLQGKLAQFNIGVQIKFNQDGSLANYYEIIQAILTCNELDEDQRKILKDITAELQKLAEMRAKTSQEIENTQQEITNISKTIADKIKEETKNALKKALERFNAKVDVEIDIEDAWRQLHKLKAELDGLRDDDYFKNINVQAKQFSEYLKTNPNSLLPGGSTQILTDHLNLIMSEINIIQGGGTSSIYGKGAEAEKQAFEDLKKYREELASNVESGLSAIKEMKQTYLSTIDAFISKNQEFMLTLEKINDISLKVIDTMKLVYGDAAIKYIDKYLKAQTLGNQKLLEVAKLKAALAENKMKDALARGDLDAYLKWASAYKTYSDEVWKYIQETIKSAQAEFENLFEVLKQEAIQAYKDVYAETSALPLDMRWDLEGERDKEFKDYTDSLYEVGTLTRKVNESINNADTVAAREKLSKFLQEDVGYLNTQIDKEKQLSKYEIERANAKYELTLRLIALEEAQNNKSKMRLRRDSQGNYRYEYVADQDKINDATQKVEDAMNKLYNLDKEYARKYSLMLSSLLTEFYDKLNEIYERQWDTDEERDAAIQALKEEYYGEYGLITLIYKQGVYARDNLLQTSADKESALIKNVEDTLKKSYQEMQAEVEINLTKIDEKWHLSQEVIASAQGTVEGLNLTWEEHSVILEGISEQENALVENLNAQLAAIEALLPEIEAMAEAWKQVAEQALAANEASLLLRETLKEEEEEAKKAEENAATNAGAGAGVGTLSSSGKASSLAARFYIVNGKKYRYFVQDDRNGGNATVDSNGNYVGQLTAGTSKAEQDFLERNKKLDKTVTYSDSLTPDKKKKKKQTSSFATGGYTGEWGSEGRLAMLHEKELVLNQNDTKNILSAVEMMRNSMMNGLAIQLGMYRNQYLQALSAISAQNTPLELNVHIDATFPNVQNSNEIEEAFNNLINLASQRINSNLK